MTVQEKDILVGFTIRQGRKVVKSGTMNKTQALKALVDAFQFNVAGAMNAFPTLKKGENFKFKHGQYNVTLLPLVNHTDNY